MAGELPAIPSTFPVIDAGTCTLRQMRAGDAQAMQKYLSDPEVTSLTSYEAHTLREAEQLVNFYAHAFARKTDLRWAIARKDGGAIAGSIGLSAFHEKHRRGELGYELARDAWGQGFATAAAGAVVRYGFEQLGLHRIEATVMTGNARSERVLERLGFVREGVLRDYKSAHGEFRDYTMFSLLRDEWAARNDGPLD